MYREEECKVNTRYPSRATLLAALRCGQADCPINLQLHDGSRTANVTLHPWTHDPLRQPTASSSVVDRIRTYCPKCPRFNPATFMWPEQFLTSHSGKCGLKRVSCRTPEIKVK